jgi:hypothetical protein
MKEMQHGLPLSREADMFIYSNVDIIRSNNWLMVTFLYLIVTSYDDSIIQMPLKN